MYDCHAFHKFNPTSVDDLIEQWRALKHPKYGSTALCPAIVSCGKAERRRVGKMVHTDNPDDVEAYRQAILADPDIPRLLKEPEHE
jgi:hypothetical protein